MLLRGKCFVCREPISWRYPCIEALTALLFLALWFKFGWPLAVLYAAVGSVLLAVAFIDSNSQVIPDSLSLGLVGLGLAIGTMNCQFWFALVGAAFWSLFFWTILKGAEGIAGRCADTKYSPSSAFAWKPDHVSAVLVVHGQSDRWEDLFSDDTDRVRILADHVEVVTGDRHIHRACDCVVSFSIGGVEVDDSWEHPLSDVQFISGTAARVIKPRQYLGLGDVKLAAGLGALLGPYHAGVAVLGACFVQMLLCGLFRSRKLPFGPALSFAAIVVLLLS